MSKPCFVMVLAGVLSACGGGSDSPAVASTASNTPPAVTTPAPTATTPAPAPAGTSTQLISMPAASTGAVKMTAGSVNITNDAQVMDVTFSGAVKGNVTGQLNKLWIDAKLGGGTMGVEGTQNTIVFRPGVEATVRVTGSANTFIMAQGAAINIEGPGAAASIVQYYKAAPATGAL